MLVPEGQTGTLPPERILASRDAIAKTSPPFLDKICCLLGVLGESSDSGHNPGFDGMAQSRAIISDSRTISRRDFRHVSDSRSGLIMAILPVASRVHNPNNQRIEHLALESSRHEKASEHSEKNLGLNGNMEFEFVTFDCYGTLIDWESGIRRAFKQALEGTRLSATQERELFELYQEEEKRIEGEMPYRKYGEVLALAASAAARKFGKTLPEKLSTILAEQLPSWSPFPDTNPALERLGTEYTLGILSNVDDALLAGTLKHFTVPFDLVVTAERVRSYKPGTEHFEEARRIIGADRGWLHVAASLYHDIEPASRLGIAAAWINRKNSAERRKLKGKIARETKDLTQLADWLAP